MIDRTLNEHIRQACTLKAQIDELKKAYDKQTEAIKAEMAERAINKYSFKNCAVTYSTYKKKHFKTDALKLDLPEVYEKYTELQNATRLTLKEV